jgi:hypothetical protein
MAPLPTGLLRPTTPLEDPIDQGEAIDRAEQGQGGSSEPSRRPTRATAKGKRRRVDAPEPTAKRGVYLADGVWERLQLEAMRKKTTASAVAGEVLDRNLPRFRVERES